MLENSLSYPGNIRCILRINRFFRLTTFDFSLKRNLHKDVEKAFGSLKERLNIRRALVWSEQSLEGKLFNSFLDECVNFAELSRVTTIQEETGCEDFWTSPNKSEIPSRD